MKTLHAKPKSGFTLIELLVVVAIIAVLVAVLLPALGSVRERTRRVMCASQLQQISTAFIAYAQDYHVFPAGKLSPSKPEDGVGPLLADKIQFWLVGSVDWSVNHSNGGELAGYNQAYSDGHAEWYDVALIAGQKLDHWIYRRPGNEQYYWYEPNWVPPFDG